MALPSPGENIQPEIGNRVYLQTRYFAPTSTRQNRKADGQVRETAHITGQTWLAVQLFFKLCDKVWYRYCPLYITHFDVGGLEGSPRFHFNENTFVFFEKVRVEDMFVFGERVDQTC